MLHGLTDDRRTDKRGLPLANSQFSLTAEPKRLGQLGSIGTSASSPEVPMSWRKDSTVRSLGSVCFLVAWPLGVVSGMLGP